jgi:hypothetical protein
MELNSVMRKYADEINGQYMEYDPSHSIIIVPVSGGRAQTVLGNVRKNELYNRKLLAFTSKVCAFSPEIDLKVLLEQTAFFNYCRFILHENHLQVEAVTSFDTISEETVKEMIQEVANLADQYELKLTGVDVN